MVAVRDERLALVPCALRARGVSGSIDCVPGSARAVSPRSSASATARRTDRWAPLHLGIIATNTPAGLNMLITDRDARMCGLVYLAVVVTGIVSLAWVPAQLNLGDDPARILGVISAEERLYRAGVGAWLLNQLAFLALGLSFYRVLRHAHPATAMAMAALVIVSVPIGFAGAVHRLDALGWATDGVALADKELREVFAAHAIESWRNTILVVQAFWGLWLLPLAYLLWRTQLVPVLLVAALALGCCGYLLAVFGDVLYPAFNETWLARVATLPAAVGEIGTCLWLLVAGARRHRLRP
jgi:hypothetical protein